MKEIYNRYQLGQTLYYGNREVVLIDVKPLLCYAKIRYRDNDKVAKINIRALSSEAQTVTTISLAAFSGGYK